jgi:hypothetical protein
LSAQGLRTCLPGSALESAVLPAAGVPEGGSPLAERAATTATPASGGGASAAGGRRAPATPTAASGPCRAAAGEAPAGLTAACGRRVVTQEKEFCAVLSPARLLRTALPGFWCAGSVLLPRLPPSRAAGPGSRAQVVAAQRSRGPLPAAWGVWGLPCPAAAGDFRAVPRSGEAWGAAAVETVRTGGGRS